MALEVSRDVLRASRLARDLRESEQRLELAAHAAGAGLWAWDAASGRIWATERARTMLGLPRTGDIVASDLRRMLDRHDAPAVGAVLDQALRRGGEHAAEFRVALAGKGTRWIAVQGSVEIDANGRPELLRGFVQDVTPRHQAEDEANELRRKLAHASRVTMLGQLSSSLAHELSQPLSAIQHNAEAAQILLTRDPLDLEELRAIIVDVVRDDRRAAEVLQRLRSWLKQGRMHMEEICLDALAEDVLALVRSDAAGETRGARMRSAARTARSTRRSRAPVAGAAQSGAERDGRHSRGARCAAAHTHRGAHRGGSAVARFPSATRARASRRTSWTRSSIRSSPRRATAWASG